MASCGWSQTPTGKLTVQVDKPMFKISPTFYGLMTEEINHSYDGGLYGELVQNRSFEDSRLRPAHWSGSEATLSLDPIPANPVVSGTALRIVVDRGPGGVMNDGFWGIPVQPHTRYRLSFYARTEKTGGDPLDIRIGPAFQVGGQVRLKGSEWRKYSVDLVSGAGTASKDNGLSLTFGDAGTRWLAHVSLFGPTYHNRPNGNRIDLMEKLGELKPSFLRLPGGNYLEGNTIAERFEWKDTIGDPDKRPGHQGPWGYRSSDGMGLLEYLEWCEDLHMQPVLAVYAGYSLQGAHVEPGKDLQPYVDDALDEIEYVTGGTDTKWGAVRAANGHPGSFPLTYIEVGNEDWFDRSGTYEGRFAQFFDAIKARFPKLQIISTRPISSRKPDVIDDHYYRSAVDMERDSGHYDTYPKTGPKIFVGEWATTEGRPTPNFHAALGDAAWLTGLERNSDRVVMESYAPLMVNVNPGAAQWPTNLIGYDALTSFGSPAFYVQALFGNNTGDRELPVAVNVPLPPTPAWAPHGAVGIGTYRTQAEFKDVEVDHDGQAVFRSSDTAGLEGWHREAGTWDAEGGVFRQTSGRPSARAWTGDTTWTNYTVQLKARKTGGTEGFMVLFHVRDAANYWVWNVGGWNDSQSAIQRIEDGAADTIGEPAETKVETGKWYDVRIDVQDGHVKCYLDGKLVNEAVESARPPITPMYACASRYGSRGDIVLKVVNISTEAESVQVELAGVRGVGSTAKGWVLTGQPLDQNSVAEPTKVAPKAISFTGASPSFAYTFPPQSVTILRLSAK